MSSTRSAAGLLLVALLLFGLAGVAHAHADFVRSEPPAETQLEASPEQVQVWFTEPLEPDFSRVEVLDATRRQVDLGDSRVMGDDPYSMGVSLPNLEPGVYTVAWQALSTVDGHVTRGTFSLLVGVEPTGVPPPAEEAAPPEALHEAGVRWLGYLAASGLLGAVLFRLLVLGPVTRRHSPDSRALLAALPALHRLSWVAWMGLLVATLWMLSLQAVMLAGEGADGPATRAMLGQLLFSTRWGLVWLVRLGLVLALGLVLLRLSRSKASGAWWVATVLGAGVLLTTSLNSHSAGVPDLAALAMLADWLHQVAVAVWVGGLLSLALVLPSGLRPLQPAERWRLLGSLVPRFSVLATASVGTLVVSGLFLAWLHVGSLGALWSTLYGQSLLLKLGLVAPLLFLGSINLLIIRPRLAQAAAGPLGAPGPRALADRLGKAAASFRQIVRAELLLAILVLLASGILTSLSPARQTYERLLQTQPLAMTAEPGDLRLTLTIAPARPGPNTFTVLVEDQQGRPVDGAERVDLRFTYLDDELGTSVETTAPQGEGRYAAEGAFISVEGRWQVELLVRQPGRDDVRAAFRFVVTATSAEEEQPGVTTQPGLPLPSLGLMTMGGLALVLAGIGLVIYVARRIGFRAADGRLLALASLVVVGLGVVLVWRAEPSGAAVPEDLRGLRNPFPPTQESLAAGEDVYRTHCQMCHGIEGRGDGPAGAVLNPRPADLREHMAAGHTDAELFYWVSQGVEGTAMPAFEEQLSDAEIWHVLNFIETFADDRP